MGRNVASRTKNWTHREIISSHVPSSFTHSRDIDDSGTTENFLNITNQWHYRISSCAKAENWANWMSVNEKNVTLMLPRGWWTRNMFFFFFLSASRYLLLEIGDCHDFMLQFTCCRFVSLISILLSIPLLPGTHNKSTVSAEDEEESSIAFLSFFLSIFFLCSFFCVFFLSWCHRKWNWVIFSFLLHWKWQTLLEIQRQPRNWEAETRNELKIVETSLSTCCVWVVGFDF